MDRLGVGRLSASSSTVVPRDCRELRRVSFGEEVGRSFRLIALEVRRRVRGSEAGGWSGDVAG